VKEGQMANQEEEYCLPFIFEVLPTDETGKSLRPVFSSRNKPLEERAREKLLSGMRKRTSLMRAEEIFPSSINTSELFPSNSDQGEEQKMAPSGVVVCGRLEKRWLPYPSSCILVLVQPAF